jgi:hypothetical protein
MKNIRFNQLVNVKNKQYYFHCIGENNKALLTCSLFERGKPNKYISVNIEELTVDVNC